MAARVVAGGSAGRTTELLAEQLAGAPAVLELPTDRARPAVQTINGQSVAFVLERELTEGLKALSRRGRCDVVHDAAGSLSSCCCTRYSGQEDMVVGTPIAGRNRAEIEAADRVLCEHAGAAHEVAGEAEFRRVLEQVREVALGAYAHQDVPFEKLVEELRAGAESEPSPLFQVMFVLQNMPHEGGVWRLAAGVRWRSAASRRSST